MLRYSSSLVVVAAATALALTSGLASALDEQDGTRNETTQDVITCDGLTSPEEQLACFDAIAESTIVESTEVTPEAASHDSPGRPSAVNPSADSRLSRDNSSVLEELEVPSVMESDNLYRREIVIQDDFTSTPLEARIVSVRVHHDGRFSVELDNAEIWHETRRSTRVRLPEPGDAVEIYIGGPGGHRMRIEGNSRVAWVRRSDERN